MASIQWAGMISYVGNLLYGRRRVGEVRSVGGQPISYQKKCFDGQRLDFHQNGPDKPFLNPSLVCVAPHWHCICNNQFASWWPVADLLC